MSRRTAAAPRPPARPLPAPPPAAYLKVRPLAPGEERTLRAVFERLGGEAQQGWRAEPALSAPRFDALADADGRRREAFVARTRAGEPVGIGGYVVWQDDPRSAQVTLAVVQEWRGRGVAGRLLPMLTIQARRASLDRLTASVLAANLPALRVLGRHGFRRLAADGRVVELARPLPRALDLR